MKLAKMLISKPFIWILATFTIKNWCNNTYLSLNYFINLLQCCYFFAYTGRISDPSEDGILEVHWLLAHLLPYCPNRSFPNRNCLGIGSQQERERISSSPEKLAEWKTGTNPNPVPKTGSVSSDWPDNCFHFGILRVSYLLLQYFNLNLIILKRIFI